MTSSLYLLSWNIAWKSKFLELRKDLSIQRYYSWKIKFSKMTFGKFEYLEKKNKERSSAFLWNWNRNNFISSINKYIYFLQKYIKYSKSDDCFRFFKKAYLRVISTFKNLNQSNFHSLNQWFALSLIHQCTRYMYFTVKSVNFHLFVSEIWLIYSNLFLAIWISQISLITSRFFLIQIQRECK